MKPPGTTAPAPTSATAGTSRSLRKYRTNSGIGSRGRSAEGRMTYPKRVFRSIGLVPVQVSVIGSGVESEAAAEEVGRLLGERGVTVVCGGLAEVMAAAARGAKSAGGTTIGILPGTSRREANEWID